MRNNTQSLTANLQKTMGEAIQVYIYTHQLGHIGFQPTVETQSSSCSWYWRIQDLQGFPNWIICVNQCISAHSQNHSLREKVHPSILWFCIWILLCQNNKPCKQPSRTVTYKVSLYSGDLLTNLIVSTWQYSKQFNMVYDFQWLTP